MSTFGDIERAFADLYAYRWAIDAGVLVFIAAVMAFGFWKGWPQVIWRNRLPVGMVAVPVLAITIWLGWFLGSPLFTNVTVEEEFPFAFTPQVPPDMDRTEVEEIMAGAAKSKFEETEVMPSGADMKRTAGAADETIVLNGAGRAALQEGLEMASAAMEDLDPALMARGIEMIQEAIAGSSNEGQVESEVVRLRVGEFIDTDAFHRGSGQAAIYSGPGGSCLLRLENLDVTNGPALHVYLSLHADPESADDVSRRCEKTWVPGPRQAERKQGQPKLPDTGRHGYIDV